MTTISASITIDASPEEVWPALADFGGVAAWNPNVKTARLTSTATEGTGIERECQLSPMGTVQERVTEWDDGRALSVEIYEFKNIPAMRRAVANFTLEPDGARTVVRMDMDYEVGLGAVGAGMNGLMLKRQFTGSVRKLLAGLKLHVETGDPVDRGADLPLSSVTV